MTIFFMTSSLFKFSFLPSKLKPTQLKLHRRPVSSPLQFLCLELFRQTHLNILISTLVYIPLISVHSLFLINPLPHIHRIGTLTDWKSPVYRLLTGCFQWLLSRFLILLFVFSFYSIYGIFQSSCSFTNCHNLHPLFSSFYSWFLWNE